MEQKNGISNHWKRVIYSYLPNNLLEEKNNADSRTFWVTTYLTPIIWVIFIIVSILSFSIANVTICLFGFVLSSTNLMGYTKCEKNHK